MPRIGKAHFKEQINQDLEYLLNDYDIQILTAQSWDPSQLYSNKWQLIFQSLTSAGCFQLIITDRPQPNILSVISLPLYYQLTKLFLAFNSIPNIEPIAFLNAPNLRTIVLAQNNVITPKSIGKMHFSRLEHFSLEQNQIPQIDITRFMMQMYNCQIALTYVFRFRMLEEVSFYAKMQSKYPSTSMRSNLSAYLQGQSGTIKQVKVWHTIVERFKKE